MKKFKIIISVLSLCLVHTFLNAQCFVNGFGSLGNLSKSTGNYYLDNWFNQQKISIERVFGVEADLFIYDDGYSPNAYASPDDWVHGRIAFGRNLLTQYLWRLDKGKAAIAAVLAHEYGHVMQLAYSSELNWKYRELHADFLAGYYLKTRAYITYYDLNNFAKTFFDLGDGNFWSELHHGTQEERLNAFRAGFMCRANDEVDAYELGEDFVLNN